MLIYSKQSFPMSNKKQGLDKGKGMHNSILFEKYIRVLIYLMAVILGIEYVRSIFLMTLQQFVHCMYSS